MPYRDPVTVPTADEVLAVFKVVKQLDDQFRDSGSRRTLQSASSHSVREALLKMKEAVQALTLDEKFKASGVEWA